MKHIANEAELKSFVSGGRVLVDFWATWCGPCRMQGQVLEGLDSELGAQIGKVNVDEAQELAINFEVSSIPTLIVFENGVEIDRMIGLQSADVVRKALGK